MHTDLYQRSIRELRDRDDFDMTQMDEETLRNEICGTVMKNAVLLSKTEDDRTGILCPDAPKIGDFVQLGDLVERVKILQRPLAINKETNQLQLNLTYYSQSTDSKGVYTIDLQLPDNHDFGEFPPLP